jgi:hypothetical protein
MSQHQQEHDNDNDNAMTRDGNDQEGWARQVVSPPPSPKVHLHWLGLTGTNILGPESQDLDIDQEHNDGNDMDGNDRKSLEMAGAVVLPLPATRYMLLTSKVDSTEKHLVGRE